METWGDVYIAHRRRGEDSGSAAFAADEFLARRNRKHEPVTCWHCGRMIDTGGSDTHNQSECKRQSIMGSNVALTGVPPHEPNKE